ncbi:unnamed protein product [Cladocopium goreaui]|uniref:C3H1-type domain-containing protein n=1 Tax=Cladocopium goreaui TaxID=2562237 RepID=A0A9P1GS56_9DINO|nr:unnamed protein product [Cladocopium goreaui]
MNRGLSGFMAWKHSCLDAASDVSTTSTLSTLSEDEEPSQRFKLIVKSTFLEFVQADDLRIIRCKSAPALHEGASQMPSVGSLWHPHRCKPCAWFWKPGSCHNGAKCLHCHLCPEGELQRRKKLHKTLAKGGRST